MIDPIIFTLRLGTWSFALRWYSVLVISGILIGTWFAERQMRHRGGNPEHLWDGLVWAIPAGVIGARLWYVLNDMMGGGAYYINDPLQIFNLPQGGLHIYGAFTLGGLAFYLYARLNKVDIRLMLDSVAPSLLIGQGVARLGNLINQELYGPPTTLPWGILIDRHHRIPPFHDLSLYPETTRFHPTFAYEMLWNFAAAAILMWAARRFEKKARPGTFFIGWLILAGIGRVIIETWRPDQPRILDTGLSYSRLVSALMAVVGVVLMLVRYEVIRLPFNLGPTSYILSEPEPVENDQKSAE